MNPPAFSFLNLDTGVLVPARCGRLACPGCCRANAWRRALAISWARPERSITLTLVAPADSLDPWQDARAAIKIVRRNLGRLGVEAGEWVSHVEPNPKDTGFHAHVWQHGSKIPKDALQEAAHRAGIGWTRIEWLRSAGQASKYGLKGLGYGMKGTAGEPAEYLRCNGGRLTHQSRGFFRGLGVRAAEREAIQTTEQGAGRWVIQWGRATASA